MNLELPLRLAGLGQLALLTAGAAMIRVTDLPTETSCLPPFLRQLFLVYTGYIGGLLLLLGAGTLWLAPDLAAGTRLARACCAAGMLFWLARLLIQFLVFDVTPYLTSPVRRLGYHATTVMFGYLTLVYGLAAAF